MTEIADRYRKVAAGFSERLQSVPVAAWDKPSPCQGWLARDVVRHLVEWVPAFLRNGAHVVLPEASSIEADPVAAWEVTTTAIQRLLDDPNLSSRTFHNDHTGTHRLDEAIAMFVLGDVLIHTWDIARAVGLDETLDRDEVRRMLVGIAGLGDALERSGQYGPRVSAADDADEQTKLLALTGRRA
jgi:uncharacterized protein (TIGR03086 family)